MRGSNAIPANARIEFIAAWDRVCGPVAPFGHDLRVRLRHRWARVHSLPRSKRYPTTAEEWHILLERQNTLIDDLIADASELRIVILWYRDGEPSFENARLDDLGAFSSHPEKPDEPRFRAFQLRRIWKRRSLDPLLTEIADDRLDAMILVSDSLIAPYDGGIDVYLRDASAALAFKDRFAAWLSPRADGL